MKKTLFLVVLLVSTIAISSCKKEQEKVSNTTPWKVNDSIYVSGDRTLLTCNDNYLFLTNKNSDSVIIISILSKSIISKKAMKVWQFGSLLKNNVFINPIDDYSFSAYDISNIQNWTLINTFEGLDKGTLYYQFRSSLYDDNFYYWIGHWNQSVQIFEIKEKSVVKHNKFNAGVCSQSISRFNNYLYVSNNYGNNKKFDINNLDSPINKGNFGNSNSFDGGTTESGYIIQNHFSDWGGGVDNIALYDTLNNKMDMLNPEHSIVFSFYSLPNGYCVVWGNPVKVFRIKNGAFQYITDLSTYSFIYNKKYILSMSYNYIYLINRPLI